MAGAQKLGTSLPFGRTSVTLARLRVSGFTRSVVKSGAPMGHRVMKSGALKGTGWRPLKISPEGPSMSRIAALKLALTSCLAAVAITGAPFAQAKGPMDGWLREGVATVRVTELPRQGQETYELIRQGGPFPYDKDGTVFGNRERLLPAEKRGYYREYTVKTPGSRDRGARRIVCGGPLRTPHACYYTADHYASFRKIVE